LDRSQPRGEAVSGDDYRDYGSGPFCRHWGDLSDCDELCNACGHKCREHDYGGKDDSECRVDGCVCKSWDGENEIDRAAANTREAQ